MIWLGLAAVFFATLLLLRLLSRAAVRAGLVDYPGRRKRHRGAIPLIGGPAIFAGLCIGAVLIPNSLKPYPALFAGLAVLLIAGILDDLRDLTPKQKFLAQLIAAACMVWWGGTTVDSLGNLLGLGEIGLPYLAIPFTIVALLGLINAINMTDGADGLAAGLSLIAFFFLALSALVIGRVYSVEMLATIIAVVAAFWIVNMRFPWQSHAKAFLGDSGSMMLGLLLTWFSIEVARWRSGLDPIAAVWFLAVPLLDMGVVILRRLGKGKSPFSAGRDHFHHVLIAAGLPPGSAVLLIYAIALALGALGFFAWRAGVPEYWMFYGFLALLGACYALSWRWVRVIRFSRRRRRHLQTGVAAKVTAL
ncbi:MAG TPA: MraY family glycosyltransferase [Burkholderiales bacterium]|nr:MraY family glycosyltransferase [Burkholderiales bacterium]